MSTIYQGGWDPTTRDRDRWRDGDRGAVALWKTARIKVVGARIIARRVLCQDHTFACWNRERAPEVKHLATWDRGMIVDRNTIDRDIARTGIVEPDGTPVVAVR